jgi:hypothetical protein
LAGSSAELSLSIRKIAKDQAGVIQDKKRSLEHKRQNPEKLAFSQLKHEA